MEQKNLKVFPTFDDIFGKAFNLWVKFYTKKWAVGWAIVAGIYVLVSIFYSFKLLSFSQDLLMSATDDEILNFFRDFASKNFPYAIAAIIAAIIYTVFSLSYIAELVKRINEEGEENATANGLSNIAFGKFGKIFVFYFLYFLMFILIAIPSILLLEIPLMILAVYWSLAVYVYYYEEGTSFGQALGKSFRLVKGNWWKTLGLFFVTGLFSGFVSGFVKILFSLFSQGLSIIVSSLISVLIQPLFMFLGAVIYLAYKKQKSEAQTEIQT